MIQIPIMRCYRLAKMGKAFESISFEFIKCEPATDDQSDREFNLEDKHTK
jgi:hypothetical protein